MLYHKGSCVVIRERWLASRAMLALGWLMPWGTPGLSGEWYVRAKLTPPGCALLNYMQILSALPAGNLLTALLPLRGQCVAINGRTRTYC